MHLPQPQCDDVRYLDASDGCSLALHDLGGHGEIIYLSHATGFHGHCFEPMADVLSQSFRCLAVDYRGFGDSSHPDPTALTWRMYGDDAVTTAHALREMNGGRPLIGVGHSMGGAALLYAAQSDPTLFRALFVFEPIVFPPQGLRPGGEPSPLADGARKRRSRFDSFDSALDNFSSKPPMMSFHPAALAAYVKNGFERTPDGGVELKCRPEWEARTYETGGSAPAWNSLGSISTPTWVMAGAVLTHQPSAVAALIADEMPNSTYVQWDEVGHFAPFEQPEMIAGFIGRAIATLP